MVQVTAPRPVTPLGILAEELSALCAEPDGESFRARLERARDLAAGLDPYVEAHTSPASPALAALARRTEATDWSAWGVFLEQEMLSGHVEGEVLATLVHLSRASRVLEVGMFTGYSALAMAEALPAGGQVLACEVDAAVAAIARECFAASPVGDRIRIEVGPAAGTLRQLATVGARFDLVFVDADKAGYAEYVDLVLDGDLLAPGGVIAVDNTLLQGEPYRSGAPDERSANGQAIAAFNDRITADPRVRQVLLPVRDGLTLIRRAP